MPPPSRPRVNLLLFIFLAFLFFSCKNDVVEEGNLVLADAMLQEVSSYQDENELLKTYYLAEHADWMLVKDKLLHERNVLLKQYPQLKSMALVCYAAAEQTPIVSTNPNFAWNHEFDAARLCSIDNNHGFWRFCYGGTLAEAGKKGDWKFIMALE